MPRLLDPLKIGSLELRNRIIMPPMATNYASKEGKVTDRLIKHYTDKTKDLGLLIVEHSFVVQRGRASLTQLGADSDDLIPGLKRLANAVHENDTPITLQITHGGSTTSQEITGSQPVSPSSVLHPRRGIEIAHGYLLSQFLSPLTNRRHDEFGGDLENRVRLACRIIEEIRRELGSNFPIIYRIGVDDRLSGGITIQEGVEAAKMIVKKGVSIMDVSGGIGGGGMEELEGPGYFVPYAAAVKNVVDIPVIGVGGIQTADEADKIIRTGNVDLVAVGRAILKDSKWATKALEYLRKR
jgi:2,4-dienoyl-CoA reductase-like NADH-dependent reductase (Old Yellow Enzyme family)